MSNELSSIVKFFLFFALIASFTAYQEIKVYRLIQYESAETVYGSQYTSLNYIGTHYKGDLLRKIALIKFSDITSIEELKKYITSNANALILILPKVDSLTSNMRELLVDTQKFLVEQTLFIPVYFTEENVEINDIYNELEDISREEFPENYSDDKAPKGGLLGNFKIENNLLQFSLSANDPKKHESINLENLIGSLEGSSQAGISNPVVAIVANYDDLSILPDFPSGLNSNASSVVAMLEIMRILSKFYENYNSMVHYDILFLLTSGGALNYQGSNHYINNLDSTLLENLQYVLCLDSLANSENELFVHLSRYPKPEDDVSFRLQNSFNSTAENMEINLQYKKKKVFLSEKNVPWEHEQYSKKKVLTSTISGRSEVSTNMFDSRFILDTEVDKKSLKKSIKFIVGSLFGILFDAENIDIFQDDESLIDEQNLDTLISYFKKYPRTPLNVVKGSQINNDLHSIFTSYLQKVQRQPFEYKDMSFYDSNSGIIKVYTVKSKMIDLYILLGVVIYLLILFIYVKGVKNFYNGLKNAFAEE